MSRVTRRSKVGLKEPEQEEKPVSSKSADPEDDDSSSSEEGPEWTADDEKTFLKTLGALKGKSDSIYNDQIRFWDEKPSNSKANNKVTDKSKPMYLKDYERKVILEKGGKAEESDQEEEEDEPEKELGYYEQQDEIRKQLRAAINDNKEDDNDDLLVKREKTTAEEEKDEADYYEWLKNKKKDVKVDNELVSLKKVWENPELEDEEKFLRDYLLNKDYETDGKDVIPTYEEIVDSDEEEEQMRREADYERKYNFRFEDPDQEFIKQYPRTVSESLRKDEKKTKRKEKREQHKEKKQQEKKEKITELKKKQKVTRSKIESKLARLRELAGEDVPISLDDIQGDFDPSEYDRRMAELFENKFYGDDINFDEDNMEKPVFSDMEDLEDFDEEASVQKKAKKAKKTKASTSQQNESDNEDDGADYADNALEENGEDEEEDEEEGKPKRRKESKRKMKRKQKLTDSKKEKPLFDPSEKTFEEYFNEYYAMDFEDIIENQPTRFRYRQVVPNSFGLDTDEILKADDKQLNAWVSLKKTTAYRPEEEEKYDVIHYSQRSRDLKKKQRILSSLFESESEPDEAKVKDEEKGPENEGEKKKKKKKKIVKKAVNKAIAETTVAPIKEPVEKLDASSSEQAVDKKKRRRKKRKADEVPTSADTKPTVSVKDETVKVEGSAPAPKKKKLMASKKSKEPVRMANVSNDRLLAFGLNPKKIRASAKYGKKKSEENQTDAG